MLLNTLSLLAGRRGSPFEEERPFARVPCHRGGPFVFGLRFRKSSELVEEIAADAWQQMVVLEGRLRDEPVDQVEAGLWPFGHGNGDGAVQFDHRRRRE